MGTRQHKTKGWVIFAVFCAVLFCVAALRACAAKAAPEGCSLKRVRPAQTAWFPLGTTAWRVSDAYGWRTDPITGEEAFHRGTDLACSEGTLVLAAMNGVVIAARRSATYGNYLCLSHSGAFLGECCPLCGQPVDCGLDGLLVLLCNGHEAE